MAFNYPYNFGFNQYQNPLPQQQPISQPQAPIIWVQGEAGAKSYLVGAGNSQILMDSEDSLFYIKTTDASGMPQPLRVFEYKERLSNTQNASNLSDAGINKANSYVTHEEFEKRLSELIPKMEDEKL